MDLRFSVTLWQMWEVSFLALAIWREARGEPFDAKVAVAHSVLNRVFRPSWWGRDVVSVLKKKWQYSSLTDPKDAQLTTWPDATDASFEECLNVAHGCMDGTYKSPVPGADSYYDDSIAPPKWADHRFFVGKVGKLNFYNLDQDIEDGTWGLKASEV